MLPISSACSHASSSDGSRPIPEEDFPVPLQQLRRQIVAVSGTALDLADDTAQSHSDDARHAPLSTVVSGIGTSIETYEFVPAATCSAINSEHAKDTQPIYRASDEAVTAQQRTAAENSISLVRNTLPAMLNGTLRIGFTTAAGRTASWAVKELLPADMGAAAMPLAIAESVIRSVAATGLCVTAAQTITAAQPRAAARAAAALCGGLMLLPAVAAYAAPSAGLAGATALRGLSDIAYVLVRDPIQNCLRNSGPSISLTRSDTDQSSHWPALSVAGVLYGLSAASWISLFEHHIVPASCNADAISPVATCRAIDTIGPAAAIEATEAASSTLVFSLFSGARYRRQLSIERPQLQVIAITAAMRLFATGILQLADLAMKTFFQTPGGLPFGICFLVMMSLEWVGGLAQQALSHVLRRPDAEDTELGSPETQTTRL